MSTTNISIIEVDLGQSVESIINDEVSELTADNTRQIDDVIKEAKAQQEAADAVRDAREKQEQAKIKVMEDLYQALLTASQANDSSSLSSQQILVLAAPQITNMISFVGRMRNWLIANKKPYKLSSVKKGKESGYRLDLVAAPE